MKVFLLIGMVIVAGCVGSKVVELPESRPLCRNVQSIRSQGESEKPDAPDGELTLRKSLELALMNNTGLKVALSEISAEEARVIQAGVLFNPKLELEVEEYNRDDAGFDSSEVAVGLSQVFELGGKRYWRKRVAAGKGLMAGWNYENKRIQVVTETSLRFIDLVVLQRSLELADLDFKAAEKTADSVKERVAVGKVSDLYLSKAKTELELARFEKTARENKLGVSRKKLAAMWDSTQPSFKEAVLELDRIMDSVPAFDRLQKRLFDHPELARLKAEIQVCEGMVAFEKARIAPDLKAKVALQNYREDDSRAMAFGIQAPLPLFDRNKGNVEAAKHDLERLKLTYHAMWLSKEVELSDLYSELITFRKKALVFRSKIIPAAEKSFTAVQTGYSKGKFTFLELLDSQRTCFAARQQELDALKGYHEAAVKIEGLITMKIEEVVK